MSPAQRKDCREARRAIERAFDGSLPVEAWFALEEHAERCPDCRSRLEAGARLRDALLSLPAPPSERIDVERSLERIHAALEPSAVRRPRWRLVAAASVLVAGALAAGLALRGDEPREPRATHEVALPEPAAAPVAAPSGGPTVVAPERSQPAPAPAEAAPVAPVAGPPTLAAVAPDPDFDPARQERARELVSAALVAVAPDLEHAADVAARRALAEEFEDRARASVGDGWPLARMVEELLRSPDVVTARAAARYLGVRPERLSLAALEGVLARTELRDAALDALADAGEGGLDALARAAANPDLALEVVARVRALDDAATIEWVRRALARVRGRLDARAARALLATLESCGPGGAAELFALADHPALDPDTVLDALVRTDGASEIVAAAVREGVSARRARWLLRAVGRLHPRGTLEWVEELCHSSRVDSAEALGVLAGFDGPEAVASLLDLTLVGRVRDDLAPLVWRRAVEGGSERLEAVARATLLAADRVAARRYLESLVLAEHPDAVPALLVLAASDLVDADDRERAILAAGEVGTPEHVERFGRLFARLGRAERGRAAACLVAAYQIDGSAAVRAVLGTTAEPVRARVLEELARPAARGGTALTLFQLARVLEPALAPSEDEPWRPSS